MVLPQPRRWVCAKNDVKVAKQIPPAPRSESHHNPMYASLLNFKQEFGTSIVAEKKTGWMPPDLKCCVDNSASSRDVVGSLKPGFINRLQRGRSER